ncbi:hypothetical protein VM94_03646 [Janthinobacterium sp. KBS0711]|nr:hypothetical protein VM94_03646 [Janthinobacterium sp. KBS0711]
MPATGGPLPVPPARLAGAAAARAARRAPPRWPGRRPGRHLAPGGARASVPQCRRRAPWPGRAGAPHRVAPLPWPARPLPPVVRPAPVALRWRRPAPPARATLPARRRCWRCRSPGAPRRRSGGAPAAAIPTAPAPRGALRQWPVRHPRCPMLAAQTPPGLAACMSPGASAAAVPARPCADRWCAGWSRRRCTALRSPPVLPATGAAGRPVFRPGVRGPAFPFSPARRRAWKCRYRCCCPSGFPAIRPVHCLPS